MIVNYENVIGTNSVVAGKIAVGKDVLIASFTLMNFDLPNYSIVICNSAKGIARKNAPEGYITYVVH